MEKDRERVEEKNKILTSHADDGVRGAHDPHGRDDGPSAQAKKDHKAIERVALENLGYGGSQCSYFMVNRHERSIISNWLGKKGSLSPVSTDEGSDRPVRLQPGNPGEFVETAVEEEKSVGIRPSAFSLNSHSVFSPLMILPL